MEKLDAFTRYLGNCGLFHFFDAIQKWVLVFTGIIVFVLTIATVFLRYVLTMNVLGLDEIIQKVLRGKLETRIFFNEQGHSVFAVG